MPPSTESFLLAPHAWVPNHPTLPVLLYRGALAADGAQDTAAQFEHLFAAHGWPPRWRDGIYDFHHYHSTAHEALGMAAGTARLILGGPGGREITVQAGDALLLPAGTGHCCLEADASLLVVGAYPPGQDWDLCRSEPTPAMRRRIASLPFPASDPVQGAQGLLLRAWIPAVSRQGP